MTDAADVQPPPRKGWQMATVVGFRDETPHARTFRLSLPGRRPTWPGSTM